MLSCRHVVLELLNRIFLNPPRDKSRESIRNADRAINNAIDLTRSDFYLPFRCWNQLLRTIKRETRLEGLGSLARAP